MKRVSLTIYLFLSFLSASVGAETKLKINWFGTTCINISDGKTALFFDPFITRPSLFQIASFQRVKSDEALIDSWLGKLKNNNIKGIFVSHTHYDHSLDLISIQRRSKAKVFGGTSVKNILKGAKQEASFKNISSGDVVTVGDFKITIFNGVHPPHVFNYTWASGEIERPIQKGSPAVQYKLGEVFTYLIEHPKGRVFFHPTGNLAKGVDLKKLGKVDLLIQGIAKRESTKKMIEDIIGPLQPDLVIPVHYDDFFEPLSDGVQELMTIDLDEFKKTMKAQKPNIKIALPTYGEEVLL